jgi:hypothetical protein
MLEIVFVVLLGLLAWQLLRERPDEGARASPPYKPEDIRF